MKKVFYVALFIGAMMFAAHSDHELLAAGGIGTADVTTPVADSGVAAESAIIAESDTSMLPPAPIGGDTGEWIAWITSLVLWLAGMIMAYMYRKANQANVKLVAANARMMQNIGDLQAENIRVTADKLKLEAANSKAMETLGTHQQEYAKMSDRLKSMEAENNRLKSAYDEAVKSMANKAAKVEENPYLQSVGRAVRPKKYEPRKG